MPGLFITGVAMPIFKTNFEKGINSRSNFMDGGKPLYCASYGQTLENYRRMNEEIPASVSAARSVLLAFL